MLKGTVKWRKVIRTGFRFLLILVAIAPLGYTIYKEWPELQSSFQEISWGPFVGAMLLLIPVVTLVGTMSWFSLRHLGTRFSYPKATGIYFFTQIFKYLPGGIWAFPGRVAVYQILGVGSAQSVVSVFRETTAQFLGAAFIGLMGLLQGLSLSQDIRLAIGIGTLACAGVILFIQLPWAWKLFSSFKMFSASPFTVYSEVSPQQKNLAWLPWTLLGGLFYWFLYGLPFRLMALSVYPQLEHLSWLEASSILTLAWCAGFVVVFAPAGIGVREGTMALLLTNIMPIGAALSLALLARVASALAEGFWILITMVWVSKSQELSWEALRGKEGGGKLSSPR
jgi:uncharacterized membrane protein YbhN (UPF0104 family)